MEIGVRVIFNPQTGKVLNNALGEMSGSIQEDLRPESIDFVDLPYGYNENHFSKAVDYYVNIETREIVVTSYFDENWNVIDVSQ